MRLRSEGVSIRRIAAEAFGDPRFRGRVERILGRPEAPARLAPDELLSSVDLSNPTALLRQLFERRLAHWMVSGASPSMSELRNLTEVQRRLDAAEQLQRLNAEHKRRRSGRSETSETTAESGEGS